MPEGSTYAVWLDRDVVEAVGEEAEAFLQGQLSQDVLGVRDGASAWTWVLSPQGKVDALARVTRVSPDRWLLDTDSGWGETMVARLNRFKLRTKVTIRQLDWKVLGLRGAPGHAAGQQGAGGAARPVTVEPWPGIAGEDLIGAEPAAPAGWPLISSHEYEAERIAAGIPKMGADIDDRTMPGETGLVPLTVSFTKGCYTGQELVARVDSRGGNVPRRLARLSAQAEVEAGAELATADGKPAGVLTSAAERSGGRWVALGYLKRGVDAAASLTAGPEGAAVTVEGLVG